MSQQLVDNTGEGETVFSDREPYDRKKRSLKVLCANFLKLYDRDETCLIVLDEAASELGAGRRRLYDVVNILESVGIVIKSGRNQYLWKGYEAIPRVLKELKEESVRKTISLSDSRNSVQVSCDDDDNGDSVNEKIDGEENSSLSWITDMDVDLFNLRNKKGRSLCFLTQNFLKLYLCCDIDIITLEDAAAQVFDEPDRLTPIKTKVRRLYDIANILSCLNLIQKASHPKSNKAAFRWVGWRGKAFNSSGIALYVNDMPNKRKFGTEVTNMNSKKKKAEVKPNSKSEEKEPSLIEYYRDNILKEMEKQNSDQRTKGKIVFGPFAPSTSMAPRQVQDSGDNNHQLSSTNTQRQYYNEALRELHTYYMVAWNAWYEELTKK